MTWRHGSLPSSQHHLLLPFPSHCSTSTRASSSQNGHGEWFPLTLKGVCWLHLTLFFGLSDTVPTCSRCSVLPQLPLWCAASETVTERSLTLQACPLSTVAIFPLWWNHLHLCLYSFVKVLQGFLKILPSYYHGVLASPFKYIDLHYFKALFSLYIISSTCHMAQTLCWTSEQEHMPCFIRQHLFPL